jgi:hypothetical protein
MVSTVNATVGAAENMHHETAWESHGATSSAGWPSAPLASR